MVSAAYPSAPVERSRWITSLRGNRNPVDSEKPYAFFAEQERSPSGEVRQAATIFLTNRECPWHCVMCDLWRNTLPTKTEPGSISRQIQYALARLPKASVLKLYNSGSFFDRGAIPHSELPEIANLCLPFRRVVVECHPKLVGPATMEFALQFEGQLEIAIGLETAHPLALEKLNKRITFADFARAVSFCKSAGIDVRTFLLVNPPFMNSGEQEHWLQISIQKAFEAGSDTVSLIPARSGNGALEKLKEQGEFREPSLEALENGQDYGVNRGKGNVFADTWDLARFSRCKSCFSPRFERLTRMNLSQKFEPRFQCTACCE